MDSNSVLPRVLVIAGLLLCMVMPYLMTVFVQQAWAPADWSTFARVVFVLLYLAPMQVAVLYLLRWNLGRKQP